MWCNPDNPASTTFHLDIGMLSWIWSDLDKQRVRNTLPRYTLAFVPIHRTPMPGLTKGVSRTSHATGMRKGTFRRHRT